MNELIQACKNKMKIVVAGKVTKDNVENLSKLINSNEFHGKKIV